jgi:small subunit ribosomal protein S3
VGQKVHPNGFRLGVYRSWEANWFASGKDYKKLLFEDLEMRRIILGRLRTAGIARIETERSTNQLTITIHTAKPGIVIGKSGASVDALREKLEKMTQNKVRITIQEIRHPELDATLVAENVAAQLEKRISYRRAIKQSLLKTMRAGALGIRVAVSGRLRGAEMARRDWDREGRVPLHTLRANIDFGRAVARTTFGVIGVKVWIYKGDFPIDGRPMAESAGGATLAELGGGVPAAAPVSRPRSAPVSPAPAPTPAEVAAADTGAVAGTATAAGTAETPAPAAPATAPAKPRARRGAAAAATEASASEAPPAAAPKRTRAAAPRAAKAPEAPAEGPETPAEPTPEGGEA